MINISYNKGFTLVELVIAVAISMILIFGIGSFFVGNNLLFFTETRILNTQSEVTKGMEKITKIAMEAKGIKKENDGYLFMLPEFKEEGIPYDGKPKKYQVKLFLQDGQLFYQQYESEPVVISTNISKLEISNSETYVNISLESINKKEIYESKKTIYFRNEN